MNNAPYVEHLTGTRAPKLWYSNINWEQGKAAQAIRLPQISNASGDRLVSQMDLYQIYLADRDDLVLLKEAPDPEFLAYLEEEKIIMPSIAIGARSEYTGEFRNRIAVPYLMDEQEEQFLKENGGRWIGPPARLSVELNSKIATRKLCEEIGFPVSDGMICEGLDAIRRTCAELEGRHPGARLVVKTAYGSSGKALFHIHRGADLETLLGYLERQISRGGGQPVVTVERWHQVERHLTAQLWLGGTDCEILAMTEQRITDAGVYRGSRLHPDLPESLITAYTEQLQQLGKSLHSRGYEGFIGVDSILDEDGTLIPVIEINARLTMVTYLLKLRKHLLERGFPRIETQSYDFKLHPGAQFAEFAEKVTSIRISAGQGGAFVYGFHRDGGQADRIRPCRVSTLSWGVDDEAEKLSRQGLEEAIREWRGAVV